MKDFITFRRMLTPIIIQVVFWLGALKEDLATDALGQALEDENPNVRIQAARGLKRLRTPKAKGLLKKAPRESDPKLRKLLKELQDKDD